jgi:hypothetical protein
MGWAGKILLCRRPMHVTWLDMLNEVKDHTLPKGEEASIWEPLKTQCQTLELIYILKVIYN